jgi:putative FmdB family regulatory protein
VVVEGLGRWPMAATIQAIASAQESPMPIYEYACQDCGHAFETLVRATTVPQCPHCQSQHLDKQLSVVGRVGGSSGKDMAPAAMGPCGTCGHPDGPGSCSIQ